MTVWFESGWQTVALLLPKTQASGSQAGMIAPFILGEQTNYLCILICMHRSRRRTKQKMGIGGTAQKQGEILFPVKAMSKVFEPST